MELITTKICMTKDIGANGNFFGGNMFWWKNVFSNIFIEKIYGYLHDNK